MPPCLPRSGCFFCLISAMSILFKFHNFVVFVYDFFLGSGLAGGMRDWAWCMHTFIVIMTRLTPIMTRSQAYICQRNSNSNCILWVDHIQSKVIIWISQAKCKSIDWLKPFARLSMVERTHTINQLFQTTHKSLVLGKVKLVESPD